MKRLSIMAIMFVTLFASSCQNEETQEPLVSDFTCETTEVLVGEEVTFKDASTGTPSKWNWVFEGAETETSILSQPVVRWMKAGLYTVSLKVGRKEQTAEVIKNHLIKVDYHTTVKADFSIDKVKAFDNQEVTFTNLSEGFPESVKWTFTPKEGDAVTSTEFSPALKFKPGVYTVKLEVSNPLASDNKEVADAFEILDEFAVMAEIKAENTTTYEGGKVYFHDLSTGNVKNREWTFEGGNPATSTDADPVVTFANTGAYKVSFRAYNEKYESSVVLEGYIHVIPGLDLVFLLPFDGNINDYGPHAMKSINYNMAKGDVTLDFSYIDDENGRGSSVKFPSGSSKGGPYAVIQMPDKAIEDAYPQGSDCTVSVWTKLPETTVNQALFAQGDCPGVLTSGSNQIWARFQNGHQFRCTAETTGDTGNTCTTTDAKYDDGQWHNITIVYVKKDGVDNLTTYLDGKAMMTKTGGNKPTRTVPYFVGCNLRLTNGAWAPENIFTGEMNDYVLYKRALTSEEIALLASMNY